VFQNSDLTFGDKQEAKKHFKNIPDVVFVDKNSRKRAACSLSIFKRVSPVHYILVSMFRSGKSEYIDPHRKDPPLQRVRQKCSKRPAAGCKASSVIISKSECHAMIHTKWNYPPSIPTKNVKNV
jgi:hypothetical protein